MPPSSHFLPTHGHAPRQDKGCSIFSSLLSCNLPWKRSNPFRPKNNIPFRTFNSEKVGFSIKDETTQAGSDYSRCGTAMSGPVRSEPYHWPHDGRLEPATTALVIIDMQRDFCEDGGYMAYQGYDITPAKNVIPVIKSILAKFRESGYPVYFTREGHRPDLSTLSSREHYRSRNNEANLGIGDKGPLGRLLIRGEPGHNIIKELRPLENEPIIDKPGRGAFAHTEFELMLSIKGIKNLIICGVTTDVCVTSTLREANDRRFDCVLVEDACAAGDAALHDGAVRSIKEEGGIFGAVTTAEELLRALKQAGEKSPGTPRPIPSSQPSTTMLASRDLGYPMMNGTNEAVGHNITSTIESDGAEGTEQINGFDRRTASLLPEDVPAEKTLPYNSSANKRDSRSGPWKSVFNRFPFTKFKSAKAP